MKELFLINVNEQAMNDPYVSRDELLYKISNKLRLYAKEKIQSVYFVNTKFLKIIGLSLSSILQDIKLVEINIDIQREGDTLFKKLSVYMNELNREEEGAVILVTSNNLFELFFLWWMRLPVDALDDIRFELNSISLSLLNINKSGERTLSKLNIC